MEAACRIKRLVWNNLTSFCSLHIVWSIGVLEMEEGGEGGRGKREREEEREGERGKEERKEKGERKRREAGEGREKRGEGKREEERGGERREEGRVGGGELVKEEENQTSVQLIHVHDRYMHVPVSMALDSCVFHWSATSLASGSSGLGADSSPCIESSTVLI